jgi:hypothetical protein
VEKALSNWVKDIYGLTYTDILEYTQEDMWAFAKFFAQRCGIQLTSNP